MSLLQNLVKDPFAKSDIPDPVTVPASPVSSHSNNSDVGVPDDLDENPFLRSDYDKTSEDRKNEQSGSLPELSDIVSAGTFIDGNYISDGNVEIKGKVKGTVHTKGYVIINGAEIDGSVIGDTGVYMKNGMIHGDVSSQENIDVSGTVEGAVVSGKTVIVRADGIVRGPHIHCEQIAVVPGGQVDCAVKTGCGTQSANNDNDLEAKTPEAKDDNSGSTPILAHSSGSAKASESTNESDDYETHLGSSTDGDGVDDAEMRDFATNVRNLLLGTDE